MRLIKTELGIAFIFTVSYIASYAITTGFVTPFQSIILPEISNTISILFLPHGVRALAFYFFGIKALVYLLPGSYLMWFLSVYGSDVAISPLAPITSLIACYVGFFILQFVFKNFPKSNSFKMWRFVVLLGIITSVFNSVFLTILHSEMFSILYLAAYLVGDVLGLIACLIIAMLIFRLIRNINQLEQ